MCKSVDNIPWGETAGFFLRGVKDPLEWIFCERCAFIRRLGLGISTSRVLNAPRGRCSIE